MKVLIAARALYEAFIDFLLLVGAAFEGPPRIVREFCPRCSKRLVYLKVRGQWRCEGATPHTFDVTDPRVARLKVPS